VPARRIQVAIVQASPRLREARIRWQRNAWTGAWPTGSVRTASVKRRRQPASRCPSRVAGPRPEPGAREGVAGQRSLSHGRHLGPISHTYRFTRAVGGGLGDYRRGTGRASATGHMGAATGVSEARPHTWRGEDNAPRDDQRNRQVRPVEANFPGVNQEVPRAKHGRESVTEPGTHEARVLVRRREMAEVGPKHRVPWRTGSRKATRRHGAGPEALRRAC